MKVFLALSVVFSLIAISCSHDPEPIYFGTDQCAHCKMTIEDPRFGAEIITKKGKVFKFDAAECMLNYINKGKILETDVESFLVIDFSRPSTLINAAEAAYLISQNLPSPMGANLSAYSNKNSAETQKNSAGGDLFNWNGLKQKLKN